jgi:inosine-uridine nucleoside N-ribohydrolase
MSWLTLARGDDHAVGSTRIRTGLLILVLTVVGCSAATPAGSGSPAPAASLQPISSPAAVATTTTPPAPIPDPPRRPLLIDTDVAADDLVALAFLLSSPSVELVGITVSGTGEAHCAGGVDVVLRLLERLEAPDIPVACGRETPLAGSHEFPAEWRERVDAGSGLELAPTQRTPSPFTAADLINDLAGKHESLTVLTTGPLTNVADAVRGDPVLAERIGPVFIMGGALHVPGNLVCCGAPEGNAVAEWNVYVDPQALNVVVGSGINPSLVSLDGTNQVPLRTAFARRVMDEAKTPGARLVAELFEANPYMTDGSFYIWDALAAQPAAGYPIGAFSPACIEVEESEGPESGFTRPTCDTPNIHYLSTVDPAAAEDTLLAVLNGG